MQRLTTFFIGMVVGGALLYGMQRYHLVRARDGFHLVPKVETTLAASYVDIRDFKVADWARHTKVAMALIQADKSQLMEKAAVDTLREGIDRIFDPSGNGNGL